MVSILKGISDAIDDISANFLGTPSYGRTYYHGWKPRAKRNDIVCRTTIHDVGAGSSHAICYQPLNAAGTGPESNTYNEIKRRCLSSGQLWEDPDFPPGRESLFYRTAPSAWPNVEWKRPGQICSRPEFQVDGTSQMDVVQGALGDCWLLAAVASLTTSKELMDKVVPPGQSFANEYAGIFRFLFWQYGRWVEVLIDDRLPTYRNQLFYMHSDDRTEFWSALLEKAYAKLNGSYEALSGGLISESLTDLTGGIVKRYELGRSAPPDLLSVLLKALEKGSLMGCSIDVPEGRRMEQELRNGLMVGHAYSVTDIRKIRYGSNNVHLIRIRNPWGDEHEWKGAWSDQSREWRSVPDNEKQAMGITFDHDGEFWMSFDDFVSNFHRLDVCLLGPDSQCGGGEMSRIVAKWESKLFDGSWRRRVNAGGCRNHPQTFWTNPQYKVSISRPDSDTSDGNGSIIVGLMQKDRRKMRSEGKTELTIGYAVYKAPAGHTGTLDRRFFETHSTSAKSSAYCNLREISDRHRLPPGEYIVVPSTFEPNEEGDFILRVFSERNSDKVSELDDETDYKPSVADDRFKKSDDKPNEDAAYKAFLNLAGSDREIDAFELQHILNILYSKEFKVGGFSVDLTRSMVAMCDTDLTGKLNYDEYKRLYRDLLLCKHTFHAMDKDGNGYFSSYEFRDALRLLGMHVSNSTFNAIVMRYSDQRGEVQFQDFVAAYIKLKLLFALFDNKDRSHSGRAKFNIEEVVKYTSFLL